MEQPTTVEQKLEQIHKDIKGIKRYIFLSNMANILMVVVPLGLLLYFLPLFLNNFLQAYLPPGADTQSIRELLQTILKEQLQQPLP